MSSNDGPANRPDYLNHPNHLHLPRVILASGSPRRSNLLTTLGINFEVIVSDIDETIVGNPTPQEYVTGLAKQKAEAVLSRVAATAGSRKILVVAADTSVVMDDRILGKPQDQEDAQHMLEQLSGRSHKVYTGIAVVSLNANGGTRVQTDIDVSDVYFRKLHSKEISAYIATGEPMDVAGSYALQGIASCFVERIEGCVTNIIGLPVPKVVSLLRENGLPILDVP